jgi:oligopeptidase A
MNTNNPLLKIGGLPAFAEIQPEHVAPAITALLSEAEAALEHAVSAEVPATYEALSLALDVPVERLMRVWSAISHLQGVADTPALRAAHAEQLPRIIEFSTRLGADERLYAKYKAIAASPAAQQLSVAQRKALSDALRDFVLGGAELQGAARERYAAIQERSGALQQAFGDHVMDATDAWSLVADEARLDGVPEDVKQAARAAAAADGVPGYKLTLQEPCRFPLLQYATDRALRETVYRADATRASEFGPAALDNAPLMTEILQLREEESALLGYRRFADLALVAKMAESPEAVLSFVRDLAQRARPFAHRELAELQAFAKTELGLDDLQAWDRPFASERLKQARYSFSSQEVKQYFTEPTVLAGLFQLIETLFGVVIRQADAPVWHDSVRYFEVSRPSAQPGDAGNEPVAAFYLDLHARAGKQSGAWMDDCRGRWRRPGGELQRPVAHLVCNFAPPVGNKPALLTHSDVITLFHEFGHGLHHMLTQVDELAVSGISGVEGDAIELPSQFMENFCWEWDVLQRLTSHVETGTPLPRELFDRMQAARHFQGGLKLIRQCDFALFDMRLHTEAGSGSRVQGICDEVNAELQPMRAPDFLRYPNTFGHIFDGGYAAGYYGYAWAQVLSADAYGAFEEAGVFDAATGARFREEILAVGGSRSALDNFRAFRGRDPSIDALLRHQGLT